MSRRGESSGVLSFTFLDVLMCTMGSLILMLVVIGDRAKFGSIVRPGQPHGNAVNTALAAASPGAASPGTAVSAARSADPAPDSAEALSRRLAAVRRQLAELEQIRAKATESLRDEQDRARHLEDHQRRLEHELAKLHITVEQLEAAEHNQTVNQDQAKQDLDRLKKLLSDTEVQLKDLRGKTSGKHSYAIVPYKGPNGSFRRPIYIECTKDAVIIQPEGIRLSDNDFDGPIRSGNPLASALRAAQEVLNARAVRGGAADMPDPYPLLIVRPDGAGAYAAALSAIRAWDSEYGYEFVEADWKLQFPEPDPKLADVMAHAVDLARERQRLLAQAAPRRYGSRLAGMRPGGGGSDEDGEPGPGIGGGRSGGRSGFDALAQSGGAGNRIGQRAGDGNLQSSAQAGGRYGAPEQGSAGGAAGLGQGSRSGIGGAVGGSFSEEVAATGGAHAVNYNAPASSAGSPGTNRATSGGTSQSGGGQSPSADGSSPSANKPSRWTAATQKGDRAGQAGAAGDSSVGDREASGAAGGGSSSGGGSATGDSASASATVQMGGPSADHSVAKKRGANWANVAAARRNSPVTRPIQVRVRADQLTVLPDGEPANSTAKGTTISFQQSTDRVMDDLAASVAQHIADWGMAGQGLYWRPALVLNVEGGAERHAARLTELLQDSGLDVRLPKSAAQPVGGRP